MSLRITAQRQQEKERGHKPKHDNACNQKHGSHALVNEKDGQNPFHRKGLK
jgi:hypothetical protein